MVINGVFFLNLYKITQLIVIIYIGLLEVLIYNMILSVKLLKNVLFTILLYCRVLTKYYSIFQQMMMKIKKC